LADLASLLQFLRVYPYSDRRVYDAHITNVWKAEAEAEAVERLKKLMKCIMLRRSNLAIDLPKRSNIIHRLEFSPEENNKYQEVRAQTLQLLDEAIAAHQSQSVLFSNALQKINTLRMMCNLGILERTSNVKRAAQSAGTVISTQWNVDAAQDSFNLLVSVGIASCVHCTMEIGASERDDSSPSLRDHPRHRLTQCLRLWCGSCSEKLAASSTRVKHLCDHLPTCPSATVSITYSLSPSPSTIKDLNENFELPTKIKTLSSDLAKLENGVKR
jgi:SWI/SNF-related matrix-associated actin-dependent regulator of chromatin subfamily A3